MRYVEKAVSCGSVTCVVLRVKEACTYVVIKYGERALYLDTPLMTSVCDMTLSQA